MSDRWSIGYIAEAFPVIRPYRSFEMLDILEHSESDEWIAEHLEHYEDGKPKLEAVIVHGRTGALLSLDTAFPEGKRDELMRMAAEAWVLPWKELPHCAVFAPVFDLAWPLKKFPLHGPTFIRAARDAGLIARLRSGPIEVPPLPPEEERRDWRDQVSRPDVLYAGGDPAALAAFGQ